MDEATLALLAQLKDIQVPAAPSIWPPAPGWWLLAIVIGLILYGLVCFVLNQRAFKKRQQLAMKELAGIRDMFKQQPNYWGHQRLVELLKRAAIEAFPERAVAALSAQDWLNFLNDTAPSQPLNLDLAQVLAQSQRAAYQSKPPMVDEQAFAAVAAWLRKNYPRRGGAKSIWRMPSAR